MTSSRELQKVIAGSAFQEVLEKIAAGESRIRVIGLKGSSRALFIALLFETLRRPVFVAAAAPEEAEVLCRDISFFSNGSTALFPPRDILTGEILTSWKEVESARTKALSRLLLPEPSITVVSLPALLQKVVPRSLFKAFTRKITLGDVLERDAFSEKLISAGYRRLPLVEEEGDFSIRGNVVDIYPPSAERPLRLLFVGDEIESIRTFDPATQRSGLEIDEFTLSPASELILTAETPARAARNLRNRANDLGLSRAAKDRLAEMIGHDLDASLASRFLPLFYESDDSTGGMDALFDYIPPDAILVSDDRLSLLRAEEKMVRATERYLDKARADETFYLERPAYFLEKGALDCFDGRQKVCLEGLDMGVEGEAGGSVVRFKVETDLGLRKEGTTPFRKEDSILAPVADSIRSWIEAENLVTFLCAGEEDVQRMSHLLEAYALPLHRGNGTVVSDLARFQGKGRLVLREGRISGGFSFADLKMIVFSEEEIFGKKARTRRHRPSLAAGEGYFLKSFGDLKEGNFVVHTDHGIGIYRGLMKLTIGRIDNDFLLIEYAEGDRLYIPVHRLDQIQRYIGPDGHSPKIDRLGGTAWETAKKRARRAAQEVAEELVALYAAREVLEGHHYSPPDRFYEEFSSSFEFEETPDQARAIEDIHLDMGRPKPMDRLVCGDAGFGKTEVAIRAAFRAAMDGKQVAVLVPTTILAEQHYQTFVRRLGRYPVRLEVLNRFKTREEQKKIVEGIQKGSVDIAIGTHRLLQKDVSFKDLGLVVIDEEQRFGVTHKEKLKKLRTLVDVLTLTATPIPRTLQLSLVGIRDLSIINTPPEGRLAISTHVLEFDEDVIRDSIRRELDRGGQVFFLHDRVHNIDSVAGLVRRLVPECRVGVAHGQMKPRELEDVMVKFLKREYDVLLCTTIIGSGIDIPTANTIIINRADRFGLSQLYQLRGRVGRSSREAVAYLFIPKGGLLSRDAQKRLQVIKEFTEPGSGFRIASEDLEIRGAGNLVGMSQSGHISAVGYEMYIQLMEKAVRELKGEEVKEVETRPEINLGLPAFIPDEYVTDMHRRLITYKRLSMANSDQDLDGMREELMDCFGYVPPQVENLFQIISIRNLLKGVLGERMDYDGNGLSIAFHKNSPVDPARILGLARSKRKGLRFTPDHRLSVPMPGLHDEGILREARVLLEELTRSS